MYADDQGRLLEWPYPVRYGWETRLECDVLVLGGGIAGCWAAIAAAREGARVVVVEKSATVRSGAGGSGCDHWVLTPNPLCPIPPEEIVDTEAASNSGYVNGISRYIAARESYQTLLEMEGMGGQIRDVDDQFAGAPFRDEETKFLFAYDYRNRIHFRVWGSGFKPALHRALKRLGVRIFDRTMATKLFVHGGRVIGAGGINVRTGEFLVVEARATILCLSRPQRIWQFQTELTGMDTLRPQTNCGNGHAMAWRAGAQFTLMENSVAHIMGSGQGFPIYGQGNPFNTWNACSMVDAKGREVPWVDAQGRELDKVEERYRPAPGQKFFGERATAPAYARPTLPPDLAQRVAKGEFTLPLYADLPGMPEDERRVIWDLMLSEEGKTKVPVHQSLTRGGFDPSRDLLQSYLFLGSDPLRTPVLPHQRVFGEVGDAGGLVTDWDLMTSVPGLFAAGDQLYAANFHHHAATTGRYAGRKAAAYARQAEAMSIDRPEIEAEKSRVYQPIRSGGTLNWKELNAASARIMRNYCGDPKGEELLNIGLTWIDDLAQNEVPRLTADDPHKLMRSLEVVDILTCCRMILHASLARKASSVWLGFNRYDYPEVDPPEWHKYLTVRQGPSGVETDFLPLDFFEPMGTNYEAHNADG